MPPQYEDYVWRLEAPILSLDLQLPQDLEWIDEITWSPIAQTVETTLTGALTIQEGEQSGGRPITLAGKDDMGWIQRSTVESLLTMKVYPGLQMVLSYVAWTEAGGYTIIKFSYNVMFRHHDQPVLDFENVKRFDNFESDGWYKIRGIKLMQATTAGMAPCSANTTVTLINIVGTFAIGDTVTGSVSGVSGTVISYATPTLYVHVPDGVFQAGEILSVDGANYGTIQSIG